MGTVDLPNESSNLSQVRPTEKETMKIQVLIHKVQVGQKPNLGSMKKIFQPITYFFILSSIAIQPFFLVFS